MTDDGPRPLVPLGPAGSSIGRAAEQVHRRLLERIDSCELPVGTRLGGERELAAAMKVSRSTVRQALAALEHVGAVRRVPGRGGGTFVSRRKFERDLSHVVGVPALLQRQGMAAGSRVVSTSLMRPDPATALALHLEPDAFVVQVVRIRLADGVPLSLEQLRLPERMFPGLLDLPLGGSMYDLLAEHFGIHAGEAIERIEVTQAGEHESAILDVPFGSPLLSVNRTTTSTDGMPFEYSHDLFRADRTCITVRTPGVPMSASARSRGQIVELRARNSG